MRALSMYDARPAGWTLGRVHSWVHPFSPANTLKRAALCRPRPTKNSPTPGNAAAERRHRQQPRTQQ